MDFDNPGFLVGNGEREVTRVLAALDITDEVIDEAAAFGAELIVSHHPIFFSLKSVTADSLIGRRVLRLAEEKIATVCMHTNLDAAHGGVNDALAEKLGLTNIEPLELSGTDADGNFYGIGRVGTLPSPMPLADFLAMTKSALGTGLRYCEGGKTVSRVAVCGGSGSDYLELVQAKGCDTFVTADVKYDPFLNAKHMGINLIDADHFATENVVVPVLCRWLSEQFPELEVRASERHAKPTARFF
jgi:dinuclear metal center YbgI/SA1388 family protein